MIDYSALFDPSVNSKNLLNDISKIGTMGDTNLIKDKRMFPSFLPYDISRAVARINFDRRCNMRKTKCTKRTPKYVFRSQKDESSVL
jgi:hypothetical protein